MLYYASSQGKIKVARFEFLATGDEKVDKLPAKNGLNLKGGSIRPEVPVEHRWSFRLQKKNRNWVGFCYMCIYKFK